MDILIKNGTLVTFDDQHTVIEDAAIAIQGDKIAALGSTSELEAGFSHLPTLDARGKAILPGFIKVP